MYTMREIPILFTNMMVQAILAGRKTMTRRLSRLDIINKNPNGFEFIGELVPNHKQGPAPVFRFEESETRNLIDIPCPYGQPGDVLYVRENWKLVNWCFDDGEATLEFEDGSKETFVTPDDDNDKGYLWIVRQYEKLLTKGIAAPEEHDESPIKFTGVRHPFSPSIHLPKWCSRIWLEVTNVRVERLQEITEADAIAEGVERWTETRLKSQPTHYKCYSDFDNPADPATYCSLAKDSFESLWDLINGRESREANPWVWAVSFKVLSTTGKPVDYSVSAIASHGEGAVIVEPADDAPKTIGQLLTEAFTLNELKADVVEKELDFPAGIITKLMNDDYYTNSVPVVLFKNLILSLHLRLSEVYKAMIPTFKVVLAKETPETIKKKPHGYQLWENKDAVIKYTAHLKAIITTGEPLTLPDNSTDMLMDALRKSEIN